MSSKKFKATPSVGHLRLEAIFHPKFENETPDSEVRRKMLAKVAANDGYLEATLKHSGSLMLWSGRQRFYSKNSTDNVFTKVGEIMLMRHFARCYGADNWREEYERCSDYVHKNRLTCSFEVVTSILGHHGDIPKRDYLILIAVADRRCGRGRFYSTNEIARFAHRFRLPHNDAWMFSSSGACESLFHSYDEMRETGTASTVIERLDRIVSDSEGGDCAKVSSLYPHDVFQGEILEGIVIRYVPHGREGDAKNGLDEMKELSNAADKLLKLVPPSTTLDGESAAAVEGTESSAIEQVDLRELSAKADFEQQLEKLLRNFHGPNLRQVKRRDGSSSNDGETTAAAKCINVVQIAKDILSSHAEDQSPYDKETLRIARLIQAVDQLNINISYKVLMEKSSSGSEERCLCILHIHNDSSFPKYHSFLKREKVEDGLMLFRGFSIELVSADASNSDSDPESMDLDISLGDAESNANEEKLMLKLKFVPYMVRTFVCRNGLSVLQGSGVAAFENHAIIQLSRWQVSDAVVGKWMTFFRGWARYCTEPIDKDLPPLTAANYLHHYNEFEALFAKGQFQPKPDNEASFQGMVVIVGPSRDGLETLALAVSKELHCSKIVHEIGKVTDKDVLLSMQRSGGGLICVAEIEDGVRNLRALAKEYHESIFVIMVEGDPFGAVDINSRKMKGITKSWRSTRCNAIFDLPKESSMQPDVDATLEYLRTDGTAKAVLEKLQAEVKRFDKGDSRPGLIVYFPSIPGSGKSSLCKDITADSLGMDDGRHLLMREGDQVKGKFYTVMGKELLKKPSSVAIMDKNVPPASFSSVSSLCAESKAIAAYVLPMELEDTLVGSANYPFPLQYLAVSMSRVLKRKGGSHNGKLDSTTKNACMVVVQFYCFYRDMTVSVLKEKLRSIGHQGKEVCVPFFKGNALPYLPIDLKNLLEEAVMLQMREDANTRKASNEAFDMDNRLRSLISENQDYIDGLTVSLDESRAVFLSELSKVITSLPNTLSPGLVSNESVPRTIKIASLDINYEALHAEVTVLRKCFSELERYFAKREQHKGNDENDKDQDRFITSVHCTFAHASQVKQADMVALFQHLMGSSIEVKATAILFSDQIAAFELEIPQQPSIPRPKNQFPHVTVWCAKGTRAHESNGLPERVRCNEAEKITFIHPIIMKGVFSFWFT